MPQPRQTRISSTGLAARRARRNTRGAGSDVFVVFLLFLWMATASHAFAQARMTTIAGVTTPAPPNNYGDGANSGPATQSALHFPVSVAANSSGDVFIADSLNSIIRQVSPSGEVSLFASFPASSGNQPSYSTAVAVDQNNVVYYADNIGDVYKQDPSNGNQPVSLGNPGAVEALAIANNGTVYALTTIEQEGFVINQLTSSGWIQVANTSNTGGNIPGYASIFGLAIDSSGDLYTYGVNLDGTVGSLLKITQAAGGLTITSIAAPDLKFGGMPAQDGLAIDALGNLYVLTNRGGLVQEVDPTTGNVTNIAGSVQLIDSYNGDGPALGSEIDQAEGIGLDQNGNLYIADTNNNLVREVANAGGVAPPAGCHECGPATLTLTDTLPAPNINQTNFGASTVLAVNSNLKKLYVGFPTYISVYSTTNDSLLDTIPVGATAMAVDPIQNVLYAVAPQNTAVYAINGGTDAVTTLALNSSLTNAAYYTAFLAVNPRLNTAYVMIKHDSQVTTIQGPLGATPAAI